MTPKRRQEILRQLHGYHHPQLGFVASIGSLEEMTGFVNGLQEQGEASDRAVSAAIAHKKIELIKGDRK